ncbi:Uncharacterised protein [Vibrio cholerae]|nr:Uncharacterised protein [Vibrio cholerae]CSI47672.1 Uncharacterised protein [Vibrio cholerae]CSI50672.1 Uncharacterised protein [Vibrio cholerae]
MEISNTTSSSPAVTVSRSSKAISRLTPVTS